MTGRIHLISESMMDYLQATSSKINPKTEPPRTMMPVVMLTTADGSTVQCKFAVRDRAEGYALLGNRDVGDRLTVRGILDNDLSGEADGQRHLILLEECEIVR